MPIVIHSLTVRCEQHHVVVILKFYCHLILMCDLLLAKT